MVRSTATRRRHRRPTVEGDLVTVADGHLRKRLEVVGETGRAALERLGRASEVAGIDVHLRHDRGEDEVRGPGLDGQVGVPVVDGLALERRRAGRHGHR